MATSFPTLLIVALVHLCPFRQVAHRHNDISYDTQDTESRLERIFTKREVMFTVILAFPIVPM